MLKTSQVLTNLWVDAERMMSNIESQNGLVMAEKVMIELVGKGVARDEAHEILRTASFQAVETGEHLKEICLKTEKLMAVFSEDEMNSMFEPSSHLGVSGEIVDEAVALARDSIEG